MILVFRPEPMLRSGPVVCALCCVNSGITVFPSQMVLKRAICLLADDEGRTYIKCARVMMNKDFHLEVRP